MDYPRVIAIKEETNGKAKHHHPHLPDVGVGVPGAGECLLMISPRQTGKSTIISNLFLNENFYGQEFFDDVVVISPTINLDRSSRFMKQRFQTYDNYNPQIIHDLLEKRKFSHTIKTLQYKVISDKCSEVQRGCRSDYSC